MIKADQIFEEGGIDQKVIAAIERISQSLRTMAWTNGKPYQLNPVQSQLLMFLLRHRDSDNRISILAKEFNITKASISDTVSALGKKGLIHKVPVKGDLRNFIIQLTPTGLLAATEAAQYTNILVSALKHLPDWDKENLFDMLGKLIFELHKNGPLPVQRMCLSCNYHEIKNSHHFCRLLDKQLTIAALQLDCPDHAPFKTTER